MKMIWALCLLFLAGGTRVYAGPLRKTKAAPQEEVNVLMFGVIQLSESLNAVYETTEAKIAKISQTLKSHEGTLQRLGRQTEEAAEVEKQMKEVIQLLQDQVAEQQAETKKARDWLTGIEQEDVELKTKVKKLEMYLNSSAHTSIKELQDSAKEHSDVLQALQHLIQFQKEDINTHSDQLSKLQKLSEAMA